MTNTMPIKNLKYYALLFLAVAVLSGCNRGPAKPKGLPELFPCSITITQSGKPLEGALVTLVPKSGRSNGWNTNGRTDVDGVAELKTQVNFDGAPAGEYVVRVSKNELSPSSVSTVAPADPIEYQKWYAVKRTEKLASIRLVKPEFDDVKKTPHKITITKGKNEATFDVGEPIKEEIKRR